MPKNEFIQEKALDQILKKTLLTPLFQPIISLKKNKIYGYEALIRGPSDSILHSPINLFDTAIRHGRLAELDLLCREVAIRQFAQFNLDAKLFLNTIPEALLQQDYQHGLTLEFLKRAGLPPQQVVLELTEQFPINDYKQMQYATDHYRQMGFSIAIDDLGAGYSSLRTWSEIKPDFVKLDRHFLQDIHLDNDKRQFVQSIIDIAKSHKCKVIGEGIEVRQEYIASNDMGIDFIQGNYFGRPSLQAEKKLNQDLFSLRKPPNAKHRVTTTRSETLVKSLLINLAPVQETDTVNHVGERFQHAPELSGLPVVKADGTVLGMVWKDEFMTLYASRYGRDLHGRKPIYLFLGNLPTIADIDMPLRKLSHKITSQEDSIQHGVFVITEQNRYRGIGSLIDLLKQITELQISNARHANPLSGLPGNVPITEHMNEVIAQQRHVVLCYFDLDNFKPYNDIYGFAKGDKVITRTAELLINHSQPDNDFVGHVGGDDFIILFESDDWQARCEDIFSDFIKLYPSLYKKHHIEEQGINAKDRFGNNVFYPLLALSVGAVKLTNFPAILTEADVSEYATKAKSAAKKMTGNSLYLLKNSDIS